MGEKAVLQELGVRSMAVIDNANRMGLRSEDIHVFEEGAHPKLTDRVKCVCVWEGFVGAFQNWRNPRK